ncbi:F-box domain-containing protein [Mycena venus]|uniref:F-box domain-containing protein n=1 Tax=Mycena venus TaxID=2733690 RepID=A0A8H7D228_9AGAR|nr:F-box domain-containing protein [Mycena venus]
MAPSAETECLHSGAVDEPIDPSTVPRDILDTNDPPAEYNFPSIQEFVSRGSARRAFLDAKIAPLQEELGKLLEERNALDTEIRKHEGALSPLRRMPTEIISLIFTTFIATDLLENYGIMDIHGGPWVLGAVCSRWRNVILSQPCFWADIGLDFSDCPPESPSLAGIIPMVEAHLARSQKFPLNITFRTFYDHECTERDQHLLNLLAQHCDRWETITLSGPVDLYSHLGAIRGNLPILRKLDITCEEYDDDDLDDIDIPHLFEVCPKLQEAFLNAGGSGYAAVNAVLPYSQLLRYSANNSAMNHFDVLHAATNLVDCVLRFTEVHHVPTPHGKPDRVATSAPPFHVNDNGPRSPGYPRAPGVRLPELQKLFVGKIQSAADIPILLHAAKTITDLCLHFPRDFASDLFSLLENPTRDPEQTAAIPALHSLSICLGPFSRRLGGPLDEDQLMRAVESQWQDGRLRSFQLYAIKFSPSAATLERMDTLRRQGMEIVLFELSNSLSNMMIPQDFRLFWDGNDFYEKLLLEPEDE